MDENNEQSERPNGEQKPTQEESPAEKLETNPPTGSLTPGAENPESKEVKKETNPNTE